MESIKHCCLLIIVLLLSGKGFSQTNNNINPNRVEVSLFNGVEINRVRPVLGLDNPENSIGLDHNLTVYYSRLLTDQLSVSAGWGFGFTGFTFNLDAKEGYSGTKDYFYWQYVNYNMYHRLVLKGIYDMPVSKNNRLRFHLGGGIVQHVNCEYVMSSSNIEDSEEYYIDYEYPNQISPFAVVEVDFVHPLKNKNEITVGLAYNHGFRGIYEGYYKLYDNTSSGKLHNDGSSYGINISYVFTGNDKKQKINKRISEGNDLKTARKQTRIERRYFDPKSTFLNVYGGIGISVTKSKDPNNFLLNAFCPQGFAGFEYEQGMENNFFITAGYHFLEYYDMMRLEGFPGSGGSNAFIAHEVSIGGGYRIITPSNLKILNLYAGLDFGYATGILGSSGYSVLNSGIYEDEVLTDTYIIEKEHTLVSKFLVAAYLGVSKDFRLTDFFYISLNYRYQFGFNPVEESGISYTSNTFSGIREASAKVDGTSHLVSFGLKFRLR